MVQDFVQAERGTLPVVLLEMWDNEQVEPVLPVALVGGLALEETMTHFPA